MQFAVINIDGDNKRFAITRAWTPRLAKLAWSRSTKS
jgi:hypothetical protein